jgi:hypothetical protein
MSEVKSSINDVKGTIAKSDVELLCTKRLLVEISVIRPCDNATANGLSPKFAVGMYFSPTDKLTDSSYNYDSSINHLFTLEELIGLMQTFGIDLDEKVWQVTEDPNSERGEMRVISNLSEVREIAE